MRESLAYLLAGSGFNVVCSYASPTEFLADYQNGVISVNLVLLDLELPEMGGIEVLRTLRKRPSPPEVLVLTVFDDRESLFSALKAGAGGYILKDTPLDTLCRALEEVADGGAPMSPAIARRVLQEFQKPTGDDEMDRLSAREKEVLQILVQGFTYDEIGEKLFISGGTVQVHLKKIYRKLGVRSRSAAVAKALRSHLVD